MAMESDDAPKTPPVGAAPALAIPEAAAEMHAKILEALEDMKALEITSLPVGGQSSVADVFVICTGTSETHCRAIADEVRIQLKELGEQPLNSGEGRSAAWTLIDFGAVVVHIFSRDARGHYDLEGMWNRRSGGDTD